MECNETLVEDSITIIVADDVKDDRDIVEQHFKQIDTNFNIVKIPSINELKSVEKTLERLIFILDIKFNEVNLLDQFLDKIDKHWPSSIRIVLSNFLGEISDSEESRIDFSYSKVHYNLNPNNINELLVKAIRKKQMNGKWLPARTEKKNYILSLNGYVNEIIYPHIQVTIEDLKDGQQILQTVLFPYKIFESVGIIGEDMRFIYVVYQEENRIVSEILPPKDDIIYFDESEEDKLPKHLKSLKEVQEKIINKKNNESE